MACRMAQELYILSKYMDNDEHKLFVQITCYENLAKDVKLNF